MDEHVEKLQGLLDGIRDEGAATAFRSHKAALTAAIEAMEGREDAPRSAAGAGKRGQVMARTRCKVRLDFVIELEGDRTLGDFERWATLEWWRQGVLSAEDAPTDLSIVSADRDVELVPVPADNASVTPTPSPDACNLPLRWPHIDPEGICEQCGQQARVHRHWHGEEVRRG